jgi:glutamyl-tRNA reductase
VSTTFVSDFKEARNLNHFKAITFTHANVGLEQVGRLFIQEDDYEQTLTAAKESLGLSELMFLGTCNRVEIYFVTDRDVNDGFLRDLFKALYPGSDSDTIHQTLSQTDVIKGFDAVRHMFHVAGSLDSLVIGEREIITQFRKAYEKCYALGLCGDHLRIAVRKTIETAKQIFTETEIANKPISVVNLANRALRNTLLPLEARIVVVGAGVTNQAMLRKLKKQGYKNFIIYNRTLAKAEALADMVGGFARLLAELKNHTEGFDALITCTGSSDAIISPEIYATLQNGDTGMKPVVDLAVPNDFDKTIMESNQVELIEVESMQKIAAENLEARKVHLVRCEEIVDENLTEFRSLARARDVERAMQEIPETVKAIKDKAVNEVYRKKLDSLDEASLETLHEILGYMEKKYISVPYKMAREIIISKHEELHKEHSH